MLVETIRIFWDLPERAAAIKRSIRVLRQGTMQQPIAIRIPITIRALTTNEVMKPDQ